MSELDRLREANRQLRELVEWMEKRERQEAVGTPGGNGRNVPKVESSDANPGHITRAELSTGRSGAHAVQAPGGWIDEALRSRGWQLILL